MRVLSLVAVLLLSSSLPAQTVSGDELKQAIPPDQMWQSKNHSDSVLATEPPGRGLPGYPPRYFALATELQRRDLPNYPARCFFIRSYNFERHGTEAPKLKNMTTCTPAKNDQFKQTDKKPKARLIPAN
jgi:hypothetical protein